MIFILGEGQGGYGKKRVEKLLVTSIYKCSHVYITIYYGKILGVLFTFSNFENI